MEKLTQRADWDSTYTSRKRQPPLQLEGVRGYCNRLVLEKVLQTELQGKRVLEVGAADSVWLPYLAKSFPSTECVGLDYSDIGCALLADRARSERAQVTVVQEDMFVERSPLHGTFDVVLSFGVAEHFSDLGQALSAKRRYVKPDGIVFTLIPNMAGILGRLTRLWNPRVYARHNPHDLASLRAGHLDAGMKIVSSGYLGSNNFGVLSSCFSHRRGIAWNMYRALFAVSLCIWLIEDKVSNFPGTRVFAPYIYAISRPA